MNQYLVCTGFICEELGKNSSIGHFTDYDEHGNVLGTYIYEYGDGKMIEIKTLNTEE